MEIFIYLMLTIESIRKIDTNGNISTWAGNGNCCDDQSDVFRTDTDLRSPRGIAFDASGNAYIAEQNAGTELQKLILVENCN